uniref:Uncharacterized protein n=1 Tax=uncultured marine virus TaxID=186617 RepID=A0A0F7L7A5_9VIRU|nr:hypothetical protein [uncultured marine virus]
MCQCSSYGRTMRCLVGLHHRWCQLCPLVGRCQVTQTYWRHWLPRCSLGLC